VQRRDERLNPEGSGKAFASVFCVNGSLASHYDQENRVFVCRLMSGMLTGSVWMGAPNQSGCPMNHSLVVGWLCTEGFACNHDLAGPKEEQEKDCPLL
jgi:hypothetical protein